MSHDLRTRNYLLRGLGVIALAYFSVTGAYAFSKGYAPVLTPNSTGVAVAMRANAQGAAVLAKVGSNVNATATVLARISKGVAVEAVVTGAINGARAGGAWGLAAGALGAVALAAIPAVADWMSTAGVHVASDGSYQKPDPDSCTVGPCYEYSGFGTAAYAPDAWQSAGATCSAIAAGFVNANPGATTSVVECGGSPPFVTVNWSPKDQTYVIVNRYSLNRRAVAPATSPVFQPMTQAQAQSAMNDSAPTTAAVQALVDANFPPVVDPVSVSGPATTNPTNTVKLGLDGAQQTETCKFYLDYFPSNIKAHPECTTTTVTPAKTDTKTVTTTNPDGSTSTATITTSTPASSTTVVTTKDEVPPEDKSECEQYPNRVGCSEFGDIPEEVPLPNATHDITFTPVAFSSNATCPAPLSIPVSLVGFSRTYEVSYATLCAGAGWVRVYVLLAAALIGAGIFVGGLKS